MDAEEPTVKKTFTVMPHNEGDGPVPRWTLLELQGKLILQDCKSGKSVENENQGCDIGEMTFTAGGKKCVLVVGNHKLMGSKETLPKPLVVTRRRDNSEGENKRRRSPQDYDIVGIIDSKYHFKTRPTPISKRQKR